MVRFLLRRVGIALGILAVLSVMLYAMLDIALDPLDDLRTSTALNKDELIAARVRMLRLDEPWYVRYWDWLTGFVQGDWGMAWRTGQPVTALLPGAISTSVQLVFSATITAILLGVTIGVVTALRQYTTFDYAITFVSFVLFSLPVFWVAVLLKQFLAIGLNDYLNDPVTSWPFVIGLSVVMALFWTGAIGGSGRRRAIVFAVAFAVTFGTVLFITTSGWLQNPSIGVVGIAVIGVAVALAATAVFAGMNNRRALWSALTTAGVGVIAFVALQWVFYAYEPNNLMMLGLLALALAIAAAIGWAFRGPDPDVSIRGAMIVALFMSVFTFIDGVLRGYQDYFNASTIRGRPIATIGAETPGLGGDYWITHLDRFTHLLLPSIALVLISFATYTRYQRGSMLEVLNQDYIRTARSKGLSERVVIVRHALRNALLPLASIVPVDIITIIGGAVITETIFGWSGMGRLFITSMNQSEADPVMAYIMIIGGLAMLANIVADILYAVLDPRIRVEA